ncbi:hypothetical protein CPB83DRAFT_839625 [Crepidotus variabilis]|uniref:Homeobox domain-containing protein n=1 Tax=Crepidotus variabilis TaxID=179855 RepID=A0A9P6E713_9AGAR|nr:hypothetical protein CPB83DRAFT_839625 [Crepidotus variabilis]
MSQSPTAYRGASAYYDSSQDTEDEWNVASPVFATTMHSPRSPLHSHERERRSSIGPMRTSGGATREKEKQKRSRVTPEQLVHLEQYFSVDRCPTSARRKDISENLGMPERQTQIWFQNRRAKAKQEDGKQSHQPATPSQPDILPIVPKTFEAEFQYLIEAEQPITIIPCADLSVGTWRRIASTINNHDLVVYTSKRNQCLTWFIHSAGYGFKMDLPFSTIVDTEYKIVSTHAGIASLTLSQPPVFYMQSKTTTGNHAWKRVSDWTEERQATKILRHTLVASAEHLSQFLRTLHDSRSVESPRNPVSRRHSEAAVPRTMRIPPPPPMASLGPPSLEYTLHCPVDRVETAIQHFYDPTGHTMLPGAGFQPSSPSTQPAAVLSSPYNPMGTHFHHVKSPAPDLFSYFSPVDSSQLTLNYNNHLQAYNSGLDQYTHSQSCDGLQATPIPAYPTEYTSSQLLNSPFQPKQSSASMENRRYGQ